MQVTQEPARLAPGELGHVGVLLLRQHRAAGGVRVVEGAEAELLGRPQHDLLTHPRQVHTEQRQVEQRLGDEVAVGDGVERVLEAPVEPELRGDVVGVQRQRRSGQRTRPQRRRVQPVDGRHQAVDVAGQRPAVREQVVGQQHRLRPLHVRVARKVDVAGLAGPLRQHFLEGHDLLRHRDQRAPAPQAEVRGDLVVAAAARVQLRADLARHLGHAPLDSSVDVLVARRERELAVGELLLDDVERIDERAHLAVGDDPGLAEPLDVRARAGEVVPRQLLVETAG